MAKLTKSEHMLVKALIKLSLREAVGDPAVDDEQPPIEPEVDQTAPEQAPPAEEPTLPYDEVQAPTSAEQELDDTSAAANPDTVSKVKSDMFFSALEKSDKLKSMLRFQSPQEQAAAVWDFASFIGVPSDQLVPLLSRIKRINKVAKSEE